MIAAIVAGEPPPLMSLQPGLPPLLERLIVRCLAKDPEFDGRRRVTWRRISLDRRDGIRENGECSVSRHGHAVRRAVRSAGALSAAVKLVLVDTTGGVARRRRVAAICPSTFRQGIVSSARFTPDGQSFVYSASWEGQPYELFSGG